jgi:hypothetical protein
MNREMWEDVKAAAYDAKVREMQSLTPLKRGGPAVCPNGHAMDEGLFDCPACGAYRPSANARPNGTGGKR